MPSVHSKEFPWQSDSDRNRRDHVVEVAKLMMSAAHTAPITGGVDHLETELIWGEKELNELAEKMDELSYLPENKRTDEMFRTEAQMIRVEMHKLSWSLQYQNECSDKKLSNSDFLSLQVSDK